MLRGFSDDQKDEMLRSLLRGDSLSHVGDEFGLNHTSVRELAAERLLLYDPITGRWRLATAEENRIDTDRLLRLIGKGMGKPDAASELGLTRQRATGLLCAAGYSYSTRAKQWTKKVKEASPITTGVWNMDVATYEDLLVSDRERRNGATVQAEIEPVQNVESHSQDQLDVAAIVEYEIDTDIQEARSLLAQAEQRRKEDMATIESLNRHIEDLHVGLNDLTVINGQLTERHAKESQAYESRITRLESEIHRLDDALKIEISKSARLQERGLLRQSMDSLRKVL